MEGNSWFWLPEHACTPVHPDTHTQTELGRWLSIKSLPYKHKTHLDPPQNPHKIPAVMTHAQNPGWGGMTGLADTHWPVSLAKPISFTFTEKPFSEIKIESSLGKTVNVSL